ncbi:sensor histidine kinase [Kitasatospora sp. NPDC048365]|uniref:sensor histidine kinase n=1 Tax=Kitasatospora sp. NPDC048365 TaxID=3364050 RepID=UPI00372185D3
MRLATRLALGAAALVTLLVLAAGLLLLPLVTADLRKQQDARLNDRAAAVLPGVRALVTADGKGRPKAEQNQQRKVVDSALDAGVRVVAEDGTVLLSVGPQPADPSRLPPAPSKPVTVREPDAVAWRVLAVPVDSGTAHATLWVSAPADAPEAQARTVRRRVFLVAALSAPLAAVLAFVLAEFATAPLRRLGRRAATLDPQAGAAAFAPDRSGTAEVDELADAIALLLSRYDEQAARTAQALDTARSFSSAASHELRTPLMSLRTNLDVLAAHPDLPAGEQAEVVGELRADHTRLQDLLTALAALARGDLVEVSAFGPVDLADLLDAAVAEAARRHPETVITAETDAEPRVFGWEPGLRIMVANLLGNAAVHGRTAGAPARITVRLGTDDGRAVLTVDDTGPGIPAEQREAVFRRFHRRPDSPGSGLGLTLVAQQAALHRGTVRVLPPPEAAPDTAPGTAPGTAPDAAPGCRIEVRLPLLRPDTPTVPLPRHRDWISGN